jgi:hypothetical protein
LPVPILRPTNTLRFALLIVTATPLLGCENLEKRTKYLTGPEVFEWESDIRFRVAGEKDMWGQAMVSEEQLSVFFREFPPGTVLTVGTTTATADDEGYATAVTKISALFGALPTEGVGSLEATLEGATFSVTPPGGDAILITLPPQKAYGVKDALLGVAQGPLLFSGETESPGPVRNAIWWNYSTQEVIGVPAPTVAEIDAVVVVERPEGTSKTCTGYTDDNGTPQPDVTLHLKDTVVAIYERRTGREVGKMIFPPDPECPTWLTAEKGYAASRDSSEPLDDMRAWIKTQVGGG